MGGARLGPLVLDFLVVVGGLGAGQLELQAELDGRIEEAGQRIERHQQRSGMPENDRPTSKVCSVTARSQNWCWRTIVISSGYLSRSRWEMRTPGSSVRNEM